MKGFLCYIWEKGVLPRTGLHISSGEEMRILDHGINDAETYRTFKNARVVIGDNTLCGTIVLHDSSNQQSRLPEGNSDVILNVSLNDAPVHTGNTAPTLKLYCTPELVQEFNAAERRNNRLHCCSTIAQMPATHLHDTFSQLLDERLCEKKRIIERIFNLCDQRWDDTLLKVAIRSFGFGLQSDTFEEWATLLNTQALGKHRDSLTQIEAIFFGQAGLLNDGSIPHYYRQEAIQNSYYNELKREYKFLANKFGLKEIDYSKWNSMSSTPHLRIARIATLYSLGRLTISSISAVQTLARFYKLLSHPLEGYWQNHTCFGGTETTGNGFMRQRQVDVIIINSIVPLLYIYGKHRKEETLCERALGLLHEIDSEENGIIKRWREQGVTARCAADSQALLHLSRAYCKAINCTDCPFACHHIKYHIQFQ